MARLNDLTDSDDELPELSTLLGPQKDAIIPTLVKTPMQEHGKISSRRKEDLNLADEKLLTERHAIAPRTSPEVPSDKPQSRKQRPPGHIKQTHFNSLLFPMSDTSISNSKSEGHQSVETAASISNRAGPRRLAKVTVDYKKFAQVSANASILIHDDSNYSTDLPDFIVLDSASDEEALISRSPKYSTDLPNFIVLDSASDEEALISRSPKKQTKSGTQKKISNSQGLGFRVNSSSEAKNGARICLESPPNNEPCRSKPVEAHHDLDNRCTL